MGIETHPIRLTNVARKLIGEEADVAVDASLAVNEAIVRGFVNHLTTVGVDGVLEAVAQLGELFHGLLLVTTVIDIAHRAVLGLIFKNHSISHLLIIVQLIKFSSISFSKSSICGSDEATSAKSF